MGETVTVIIDRPLGSQHPEHPDIIYPINYGFVEGIMALDEEEQDVYVLGVSEPIKKCTGKVIAIIQRKDDIENKWVIAPQGQTFSKTEIIKQVNFQEQFFETEVIM